MANNPSSKKRARQSIKRTARNRIRKEKLKKSAKNFQSVIASGDAAAIKDEVKKISKAVDKACVKGIIHKNTANRKKSRLAKAANRAAAGKA